MNQPAEKAALFSGVLLLLLAAIVATAALLWQNFVDFTPGSNGLVDVQDGISNTPGLIVADEDLEHEIRFIFDVPRGEVVEFLENVRPTLATIAAALNRRVQIDFAENHIDILGRVTRGESHIGAISALMFARYRHEYPVQAILERSGQTPKTSLFVVRTDSSLHSLSDLSGTSIAFKDLQSLSGNFVPRLELRHHGCDDPGFFRQESFTGNLSNSLIGLLNKEFDCIVLSNLFFNEQPEHIRNQLRIIHTSAPMPGGIYLGANTLPATFVADLQQKFLEFSDHDVFSEEFGGYFRVRLPQQEMLSALEQQGDE